MPPGCFGSDLLGGDVSGLAVALLDLHAAGEVHGIGDHLQRLGEVQREKPQERAGVHPDGVVLIGNIYGLIRLEGQLLERGQLRDGVKLASSAMESNLISKTINHTSFMGWLKYNIAGGKIQWAYSPKSAGKGRAVPCKTIVAEC